MPFYRRGMTATRRWATTVVTLLSLVGLSACSDDGPEIPDPPPPALQRLDGTLYFLGAGQANAGLWTLAADGTLRRSIPDPTPSFWQTVTVSPDGSRYSWIDGGQLRVATFGSSPALVGAADLDGGFLPQWSADGSALIVRNNAQTYGRLDLASATFAALPPADHPYALFSVADAAHAIYGTDLEWSVVTVDDQSSPVIATAPPFQRFSRFQSLAPDGRHVIALLRGFTEPAGGDELRTLAANAIVDVVTGRAARVPGNATLRQGLFRPDGSAVLRVSEGLADRMILVTKEGEVSDRVGLPAEVKDLFLLGYAPTPEPEVPPTPEPTPEPTPTLEPEPPAQLPGTLFLLGLGVTQDDGGIWTLVGDTLTRTVPVDDVRFPATAGISPDGTRYAWVDDGQLVVTSIGAGPVAVGPPSADDDFAPQWSRDGASLILRYEGTGYAQVNVATGELTELPSAPGPYLAFSADGAYAVYAGAGDVLPGIVQLGTELPPVPVVAPEGERLDGLQSLSPDGQHAIALLGAAGEPYEDPGRVFGGDTIVDLTTGEILPVPGGGTLRSGYFLADGSLVLMVTEEGAERVLLVSREGEVQARADLPAAAAALIVLGFTPTS